MVQRDFPTGMYVVDENYTIINLNRAMQELYPDVKIGDTCYRSVALRESPCTVCPLAADNSLFYNPVRKEWIYANAAKMPYPGCGECYHVQFQMRQRVADAAQENLQPENMDEHIAQLSGGDRQACAIGGYCEPGSPLFYANQPLLELLGYDSLEELYRDCDGLVSNTIHPDDLERVTRDLTRCAQQGGAFRTTYRIHHKNNSWNWIVSRGKRVETGTGVFALLCVINDMSEYLERQGRLHEENEKLLKQELTSQAVLQHMPGGYHRCADAPGFPFLYVGRSFEEITGWTRQEIEEQFDDLFINMVLPEDIPLCAGIVERVEKQGYSNDIYRIKRKGGGYRWVSDATMRVDIGDEHFYQGVLADVTDYVENHEQVLRELEEAKQEAEDSSRAKSTFLFNVSHDIRTPMNAIQGFAHILSENIHDPQVVQETVGKIRQSSEVLLRLLNDVLELSRIESGKDKPQNTSSDLGALAENLRMMFESEAREAGIRLEMDNDLRHSCVLCDQLKCTRILMNMLSNARKFTPAGGTITFGIRQLAEDGQTGTYCLFVRDTGIGMSPEFQQRAFEEFEREKTSTDSGKVGSGLGLAIIKRLVDLMGGQCRLESTPGKGTYIEAVLTFPLSDGCTLELDKKPLLRADLRGKRLLLVEDNAFNREIARYVFAQAGFLVEEAENGAECLEKLQSSQAGRFDAVLMDIQMPVMDGYAATRAIRAFSDRAKANIPIVAMTANAFAEDRDRCLSVGMNGHVGKPFTAADVVRELSRVL